MKWGRRVPKLTCRWRCLDLTCTHQLKPCVQGWRDTEWAETWNLSARQGLLPGSSGGGSSGRGRGGVGFLAALACPGAPAVSAFGQSVALWAAWGEPANGRAQVVSGRPLAEHGPAKHPRVRAAVAPDLHRGHVKGIGYMPAP